MYNTQENINRKKKKVVEYDILFFDTRHFNECVHRYKSIILNWQYFLFFFFNFIIDKKHIIRMEIKEIEIKCDGLWKKETFLKTNVNMFVL